MSTVSLAFTAAQVGRQAPYWYLPGGWDACWRAAVAAQASTPAKCVVLGDSISQGTNTVTIAAAYTQSWPGQVMAALLARSGNSLHRVIHNAGMLDQAASYAAPRPFIPTSGTWGGDADAGGPKFYQSADSDAIQLNTQVACTAIDLYFERFAAVDYVYSVDGGAPVQAALSSGISTVQISGLSSATHTVEISTTPAKGIYMRGAACYPSGRSAGGISFWNHSRTGMFSDRYDPATRGTYWQDGMDPWKAHLLVIALGVNDTIGGTLTASQYRDRWRDMIECVRRGTPGASILFVAPSYPNKWFDGGKWTFPTDDQAFSWVDYIVSMKQLCDHYCCGLLNVHAAWGPNTLAAGYQASNNVHPELPGATNLASLVTSVL